jgi:hypothetical protein
MDEGKPDGILWLEGIMKYLDLDTSCHESYYASKIMTRIKEIKHNETLQKNAAKNAEHNRSQWQAKYDQLYEEKEDLLKIITKSNPTQ